MRFVLVIGLLLACAPRARADDPPWVIEVAERCLLQTSTLESSAVSDGGDTPATCIAYRHLLRRPDAVQVFERLLGSPRLASRLYGLLGLRHLAPYRFAAAAAALVVREGEQEVGTFEGCFVSRATVRALVRRIDIGEFDDLRADGEGWEDGGPGVSPDGRTPREWVDAFIAGHDRAFHALYTMGPLLACPELGRALAHEDPRVRAGALELLYELTPWILDVVDPVRASLAAPDLGDEAHAQAVSILVMSSGDLPSAEAALLHVLRTPDEHRPGLPQVLEAAGEWGVNEAELDAVAALLRHADEEVRTLACDALREIAREHAEPSLRERAAALVRE